MMVGPKILPQNLFAMATSLEGYKEGQIYNLRRNTYHLVKNIFKIGLADAEIIVLQEIIKTLAKHIPQSALGTHAERAK